MLGTTLSKALRKFIISVSLPLSTDIVTSSQKGSGLIRQDLPLMKPCLLSQTTSLLSMCLSTASRRMLYHLPRHRSNAGVLVDPFILFKNRFHVGLLFTYPGYHLTVMNYQIPQREVWQLHWPIPSRLWDVPHQVPQTHVCSISSGGLKLDLLLQQV